MPPETILDLIFTTLATGAIGSLLWVRLNRLELGLAETRSELAEVRAQMATRTDLSELRGQLTGELSEVRDQMANGFAEVHDKMANGFAEVHDKMANGFADVHDKMARRTDLDKLREEMAVMRSDLTHVALAIGANRPRPMEG